MSETKTKATSKSKLAKQYNVDVRTFSAWIKPHMEKIGEPTGRIFTPKQVAIIFDCIGTP